MVTRCVAQAKRFARSGRTAATNDSIVKVAQTWAVIAIFGAFAVGVLAMMWARMDRLDAKIEGLGTRLDAKIEGLGTRLDAKIEGLGTRLDAKIEGLGTELRTEMGQLRGEMGQLRGEVGELRQGVHALAEGQAEMIGEQHVLRDMAHTHTAA